MNAPKKNQSQKFCEWKLLNTIQPHFVRETLKIQAKKKLKLFNSQILMKAFLRQLFRDVDAKHVNADAGEGTRPTVCQE